MTDPSSAVPLRTRTALLASAQQPLVAWLRAALESSRYSLEHVATGQQLVVSTRQVSPDLILLDAELPGVDPVALCRGLRWEPTVGPYTPILVLVPALPPRAMRLSLLRAGAWDIVVSAPDAEEFALKANLYAQLKRAAELGAAESHVDPETGFYSLQGIARRAREIGALAARQHSGLACIVLAPQIAGPPEARLSETLVTRCADLLRTTTRDSDALGRLTLSEFAVVAPGTDSGGALVLARRLVSEFARQPRRPGEAPIPLRAGYDAVANMSYAPVNAVELLGRANTAERQSGAGGNWIRAYGEPGTSG